MFIPKVNEIKRRRLEAGYNCQELSLLAGLPKNAIYRIELSGVPPVPQPRLPGTDWCKRKSGQ